MSDMIELTKDNFHKTIQEEPAAVLVDFWAPWCAPCRMIAPELQAVAQQLGSKIRVAKVNVDTDPELAAEFGISGIPNLVLFKEGKPVRQWIGFTDRKALINALQ